MAALTPRQRRALQLRHLAAIARAEAELRAAVAATLVMLAAAINDPEMTPADQQTVVTQAEDDVNEAWLALLLLLFGKRYDDAGGDPDQRAAALDAYRARTVPGLLGSIGTVVERLRSGSDPNEIVDNESTLVARTEVIRAYNGGAFRGLAGEPDLTKTWLSLRDTKVRPTHAIADGQTVPLAQKFQVGAEQADYPGDPSLSAAEACNCRCVMLVKNDLVGLVAAIGESDMTELPDGWRGPIAGPLGKPTGDTRILGLPTGGVRSRDYPMALTRKHVGNDDIFIGTIELSWYNEDDGMLWGEGTFDLGGEDGAEAARQLLAGLETVSIHPDEVTWEQWILNSDGQRVEPEEAIEVDDEGYPIRLKDGYTVWDAMVDWQLAGLAVVSIPAYQGARIEPVYGYVKPSEMEAADDEAFEEALKARKKKGKRWPSYDDLCVDEEEVDSVVAAAVGGQVFTKAFFANPGFTGPTPLTVTPEGRVQGHVSLWNSCYMAPGGRGGCLAPPRGADFTRFQTHGARMDDDSIMPVGAITFGAGHSSAGGLKASMRQYADVATVAAKVVVGEDEFGIWVSGEVVDEFRDKAYDLLLSPLSGHWEPDLDNRGKLTLIAAHVVVSPGYHVPRVAASYDENDDVECVIFTAPVVAAVDPADAQAILRAKLALRALANR